MPFSFNSLRKLLYFLNINYMLTPININKGSTQNKTVWHVFFNVFGQFSILVQPGQMGNDGFLH